MAESAPGHPHDHRHRPAPAVSDLRRVVHELVETVRDEVVELHLTDRPLAGERRANADTEDTAFRERRVDDAVAELGQQRAQQQERVAVGTADILAIDEDPRVRAQCVANTQCDGFEESPPPRFAGEPGSSPGKGGSRSTPAAPQARAPRFASLPVPSPARRRLPLPPPARTRRRLPGPVDRQAHPPRGDTRPDRARG